MSVGFPTKANWAAGDVLTASAQDDLAGTVNLLSNASAASGSQLVSNVAGTSFAYQATPSASNPILNSGFNVWQRGTSIAITASTANVYTADRWALSTGANEACTVSRQATSDTTNLPFIQYCARVQRNSGQTGTGALNFDQSVESINSIPFAGKTITLSFYARAGANFSPTASNFGVQLISGTGTDQNLSTASGIAVINNVTPGTNAAALTTTWQRFSCSGTMSATATQLFIRAFMTPAGTAGTNDYYEITGVQIDIGSVALPFRTYAATYQGELAACQRYAWTIQNGFDMYFGLDFGGGAGRIGFVSPTTMRASASYTLLSGTPQVRLASLSTVNATPSLATGSANSTSLQFSYTGGVVGTPISYVSNGSIILLSAEL